jgi:hypothetical protein
VWKPISPRRLDRPDWRPDHHQGVAGPLAQDGDRLTGRLGEHVANYAGIVAVRLKPALGGIPLVRLTPEHVDKFLADALSHAERCRLVTWNVAKQSVMPKCKPTPELRSFTADEPRAILEASEVERLHGLVVADMTVGPGPGEISGLLWDEMDLKDRPPTLAGPRARVLC